MLKSKYFFYSISLQLVQARDITVNVLYYNFKQTQQHVNRQTAILRLHSVPVIEIYSVFCLFVFCTTGEKSM